MRARNLRPPPRCLNRSSGEFLRRCHERPGDAFPRFGRLHALKELIEFGRECIEFHSRLTIRPFRIA
jgi:hypothetical protein